MIEAMLGIVSSPVVSCGVKAVCTVRRLGEITLPVMLCAVEAVWTAKKLA
jgi:hypothetical protein